MPLLPYPYGPEGSVSGAERKWGAASPAATVLANAIVASAVTCHVAVTAKLGGGDHMPLLCARRTSGSGSRGRQARG